MSSQWKVILDKSFLQAERRDCRRLRELRAAGATFVITDTLIYELCSAQAPGDWKTIQKRLFEFHDRIEVWNHVGPLLKEEVKNQKPLKSPLYAEVTNGIRSWFERGEDYVPEDLPERVARFQLEREVENVEVLIKECRDLCERVPEYARMTQRNGPFEKEAVKDLVRNPDFLKYVLKRDHGNPADCELFISGAETGLSSDWFAYHNAKSLLTLYGLFLLKYGLANQPGRDFTHTRLDSEYAALLHYADALATNETSGGLATMVDWMYGDTKVAFSTSDVDACLHSESDVRFAAYEIWTANGRTHGHDLDDWLAAEQSCVSGLWRRLRERTIKAP